MKKSVIRNPKAIVMAGLFVALIALRMALPFLILNNLNAYLATFSPIYSVRIGAVHLSFFTTSYRFEKLTARYKADDKEFFNVDSAVVSLAWRELLHARILTNVTVDNGKFILTQALLKKSKAPDVHVRDQAEKVTDTLFPVKVAAVDIHNSYFDFADFVRKPPEDQWRVFKIESEIKNITPTPKEPLSNFTFSGTLLRSGQITASGEFKKLAAPVAWKTNFELQNFNLPSSNAMLIDLIPFTFAAGTLEIFSEVKSQNGKIVGYVKPFFKDVKVIQDNQSFKSVQHFAFEIIGALSNLILRTSDSKTVATRIAFHEDHGEFKIDKEQAVKKALQNGFEKPLSPSFDHSLKLN